MLHGVTEGDVHGPSATQGSFGVGSVLECSVRKAMPKEKGGLRTGKFR